MPGPPFTFALHGRQAVIRGVVFDLDGTLYPLAPARRFMIRRLLLSLRRLDRYTKVRRSMHGEDAGTREALFEEALRRLEPERPDRRPRWRQWIRGTYDPLVARAMGRAVQARPGARAMLEKLAAGGVKLALVSDYLGVDERLDRLGIPPELFSVRLETEAHGAMKPAARLGSILLEAVDLPAQELLMVGDRPFADEAFAETVGMAFAGVADDGREDPHWAPWTEVRDALLAMVPDDGA